MCLACTCGLTSVATRVRSSMFMASERSSHPSRGFLSQRSSEHLCGRRHGVLRWSQKRRPPPPTHGSRSPCCRMQTASVLPKAFIFILLKMASHLPVLAISIAWTCHFSMASEQRESGVPGREEGSTRSTGNSCSRGCTTSLPPSHGGRPTGTEPSIQQRT